MRIWSNPELTFDGVVEKALLVMPGAGIPDLLGVPTNKRQLLDNGICVHFIEGDADIAIFFQGSENRDLSVQLLDVFVFLLQIGLKFVPHLMDLGVQQVSDIVIKDFSPVKVFHVDIFESMSFDGCRKVQGLLVVHQLLRKFNPHLPDLFIR